MPAIPEYLIPIIALVVVPLSGWLNDDGLPRWFNAIVSAIVVVAFALFCFYLTHALTNDLAANFMIVVAFAYALILGPFAPLHKWFFLRAVSPLRVFAPSRQTISTEAARPPTGGNTFE